MINLFLVSCNSHDAVNFKGDTHSKIIDLNKTQWSSNFYYYHNNYFFQTDSTGYSEDGQLARTLFPDTLTIKGDSILYNEAVNFKYSLVDTVLTLNYFKHNIIRCDQRIFILKRDDSNKVFFMSQHEYAYGRENLRLKE